MRPCTGRVSPLQKGVSSRRADSASELSPRMPAPVFTTIEVHMQGTIMKVVRDRGFGFIHADDGREIFFHHTSLQQLDLDSLKEGQNVQFDVERAEKGREPSTWSRS